MFLAKLQRKNSHAQKQNPPTLSKMRMTLLLILFSHKENIKLELWSEKITGYLLCHRDNYSDSKTETWNTNTNENSYHRIE